MQRSLAPFRDRLAAAIAVCLFALISAFPICARADQAFPTVCVESVSGSAVVLARFGYVAQTSITLGLGEPINSAGNYFASPFRSPAGEPDQFLSGYHPNVVNLLLSSSQVAQWFLGGTSVSAYSAAYATSQSPKLVPTPVCPVAVLPATLSYAATGTYTNVFLGQVDSGPAASDVTLSALSTNPAITISNLVYTPGDTASPITSQNPNSIYGTVTVGLGGDYTSPVILLVSVNGAPSASAFLPVSYTGVYRS